jgi:hypothetical protein
MVVTCTALFIFTFGCLFLFNSIINNLLDNANSITYSSTPVAIDVDVVDDKSTTTTTTSSSNSNSDSNSNNGSGNDSAGSSKPTTPTTTIANTNSNSKSTISNNATTVNIVKTNNNNNNNYYDNKRNKNTNNNNNYNKHNIDNSNFDHLSSEQYDELLELLQPISSNNDKTSTSTKMKIYHDKNNWDGAPIVLEKYKLVFFTQGKVACTVFKQLIRRMADTIQTRKDWKEFNWRVPHDPNQNGLKYLYHYGENNPLDVLTILTNPNWTRVIFVRDPMERTLSAYLDKAVGEDGIYVKRHCCNHIASSLCGIKGTSSFLGFLQVINEICCCDNHWEPQSKRIDKQFRPFINFVGKFDTLQYDTKRMLDTLSANMNNHNSSNIDLWNQFGSNGWGNNEHSKNLSIFAPDTSAKHKTSASDHILEYYNDTNVISLFKKLYQIDYDDTLLNFSSSKSKS